MSFRDSLFNKLSKATQGAVLALCCIAGSYSAQATERQALTLLESHQNRPITEIIINGQSSQALLDTGATVTLIQDELLETDTVFAQNATISVRGLGGHRALPITHVEALQAGTQTWFNLRAVVNSADDFPIEQNILPVALLDGAIVDFDFRNASVQMYDGYPKMVAGAVRNKIKYFTHKGLIFIPVEIDGVRGNALIDTGSTVTFINAHFSEQARGLKRVGETQEIQGSDLKRNELRIFGFEEMQLGNKRIKNFSIPVLETELFTSLGFQDAPMMVIGMDLLSNYRMQIDRKRERIILLR